MSCISLQFLIQDTSSRPCLTDATDRHFCPMTVQFSGRFDTDVHGAGPLVRVLTSEYEGSGGECALQVVAQKFGNRVHPLLCPVGWDVLFGGQLVSSSHVISRCHVTDSSSFLKQLENCFLYTKVQACCESLGISRGT